MKKKKMINPTMLLILMMILLPPQQMGVSMMTNNIMHLIIYFELQINQQIEEKSVTSFDYENNEGIMVVCGG